MIRASSVILSSVLALGCSTMMGEPPPPKTTDDPMDLLGPVDEAVAAQTDPCGGVSLATCEVETRGACGVVPLASGDLCAPGFPWNVEPDGDVVFASSWRTFTVADLEGAPLAAHEEQEAAEMLDRILSSELADPEGEDLLPLAAYDHSSTMCKTSDGCYKTDGKKRYRDFKSHYNNAQGVHMHVVDVHVDSWVGVCHKGSYLDTYSHTCGTR